MTCMCYVGLKVPDDLARNTEVLRELWARDVSGLSKPLLSGRSKRGEADPKTDRFFSKCSERPNWI